MRVIQFITLKRHLLKLAATLTVAVPAIIASPTFSQATGKAPTDEMLPGKGPAQKGDWFDKIWTERRTEFSQSKEADQGAIVFLGDSITQGWGDLRQHFPKYHCANRGIGGDTTRGILYRLQEDVLDLKPAAVVLLIGTNDIGIGADPADIAENMKAILAALKAANPKMPVIVCKVMPSDSSKQRPADKIQRLNALVDEIVAADAQFIRCDTYSIFANENGNAKKDEFPDLLHLNAAAYAKWVGALDPILSKLNPPPARTTATTPK
ncbi:MAG TPA: GDSL-type esterase/lipase family protein [Verrucomicrobiota bacterium]|nr:GDSL-type esterase/lipase family protein [Verrucomicrobiota bacterium]